MASVLISGPAGAGKSQAARDLLAQAQEPTAIVDFQAIYSAMLLLRRLDSGRFPERNPSFAYLLPLAETTRQVMIAKAREMDVEVIATNSDGSPARREYLTGLLGPGSREVVIDPGRAIVVERLSSNGVLSRQCGEAISRWYGRV